MRFTADDRARLLSLLEMEARATADLDFGPHRTELRSAVRERVLWLRRLRDALLVPGGIIELPRSERDGGSE